MIRRFVITGMATFLSLGSLKAQSTEPPKIPNYLKEDAQSSGNPFHAYAWVPIPDPLTREQPDGALLGPPGSAPPPYALFRDADFDPAWGSSAAKNDLLYQLKLIPLDRPAMAYLSLGGELAKITNDPNYLSGGIDALTARDAIDLVNNAELIEPPILVAGLLHKAARFYLARRQSRLSHGALSTSPFPSPPARPGGINRASKAACSMPILS